MENCCKTCAHFYMHYVQHKDKYIPIDFGHCVFPRIKSRDAATKACAHFESMEKVEKTSA